MLHSAVLLYFGRHFCCLWNNVLISDFVRVAAFFRCFIIVFYTGCFGMHPTSIFSVNRVEAQMMLFSQTLRIKEAEALKYYYLVYSVLCVTQFVKSSITDLSLGYEKIKCM